MIPGLRRDLGLWDATSVVIGAIIGVGIFFTPGQVAQLAGSANAALGLWALGGLIAALGALTFAELSRAYPRAGGQYDVLRDAWGPLAAFLYVFCNLTAIQGGSIAIIAWYCAQNFAEVVGVALSDTVNLIAAVALIAGLTLANVWGLQAGAGVQNVTVLARLATAAGIVLIAFLAPPPPAPTVAPTGPLPSGIALLAGVLPAMFAYGGWQQALWMGGEVRHAERNLPRAIILGVTIVIVAYMGSAWAFFRVLGFNAVASGMPLAPATVAVVLPGVGAKLAALAVGVSAFGVLNAQLLTGPRLVWALAEDGRFFSAFRGVHPRFGTPVPAVLLLGGLGAALLVIAGADGVDRLTAWVVVVDAVFFALTGLALVRFLVQQRRFTWVWIPLSFAALELAAVGGAAASEKVRNAAATGALWIAGAAVVYAVWFRPPTVRSNP